MILTLAMAIIGTGCQTTNSGAALDDPAMTALGQASIKIMEEKMKSPYRGYPTSSQADEPMGLTYLLSVSFDGTAAEAVMGLAQAMGYGFVVKNDRAGRLPVTINPTEKERTIFWLISDINRQLKKERAFVGVDSVNKRLVISASEVD
jgi:hypothetical protein